MSERPAHLLIKELSQILAQLSGKVVGNFLDALHAVKHHDDYGARHIRIVENEIDVSEINLEERCLAFLALQQPVAMDLRAIVTIIKINDELKHIGDLAIHIIDRIPEISPEMLESFEFENICMHACEMVKMSIEAFVSKDSILARLVSAMDEDIDSIHRKVFKRVTALMKNPDSDVDQLIAALSISRYIERMADHATRIADEVVFLITGEMVRHTEWSYDQLITS
ncbi:MAG: phosphate signaling complex protein PhoU [Chlorobiaceae bacterium]|jgi:phosphate transport system protein